MLATVSEDVCGAALTVIDRLIEAADQEEMSGAAELLTAAGSAQELETAAAALVLVCEQLAAKYADTYGVDKARVLRQVAGEIVFQHRRLMRRTTPVRTPALRIPPRDGTDLLVVRL